MTTNNIAVITSGSLAKSGGIQTVTRTLFEGVMPILYLDKEGGVDIDDCEAVSRAVDPVLDEKDPIPESYRFEVCSAGLERQLKRPSDFERYLGEPVLVKLYRPRDGQKEFPGRLVRYEDGAVTIEMRGREVTFDKAEVALVRLRVEF